jgi:class 3 adenylate cyclase
MIARPRLISTVVVLGAVLLAPAPARGSAGPEIIELAGPLPCFIEYRDGRREERANLTWPALSALGANAADLSAIECRVTIAAALRSRWKRPTLLLGPLGRHPSGSLSAWVDGELVPESERELETMTDLAPPLPLFPSADPSADTIVRVRLTDLTGLRRAGAPAQWLAGDEQAVLRHLLSHYLPDFALAVMMLLIAFLALSAAMITRRAKSEDATSMALLAALAFAIAVGRLHDNPLRSLAGAPGAAILHWLRGPLGLIIVPLIIELMRRHFGIRLRVWFVALYVLTGLAALLRVATTSELVQAPQLIWLTLPFLILFLSRAIRDPRPGARTWFAGLILFAIALATRTASLSGRTAIPDVSSWGFYAITIAALIATIQAAVSRRSRDERARTLGRFLPSALVHQIIEGVPIPKQQRARLVFFWSDLAGFSRASDRLEPEVASAVLNDYLSAMAEIVERYGATLERFVGASVRAFFGGPASSTGYSEEVAAKRCAEMSLEMAELIESMNARWLRAGVGEPLRIRAAIHSGFATVGEFGSEKRSDYTAIGSQVNFVQRLAEICPPGEVLITQDIRAQIEDQFPMVAVELPPLGGTGEALRAWALKWRLSKADDREAIALSPTKPSLRAPTGSALPAIGDIVDNSWRLVRLLGQGGMGCVFEAQHLRLPRRSAVKFLVTAPRDPAAFARFKLEAEIASSTGHPNIVEAFDFNVTSSSSLPYMILELLEGEDLRARLRRVARIPLQGAIGILDQVADALQTAHDRQVIHRDLKPENIFLTRRASREDFVKVLDFGISKMLDDGSDRTRTGAPIGTLGYMSPEQTRGEKTVGIQTDIFSLGVIAFELLAGKKPFGSGAESLYEVCHRDPPPISDLVGGLPIEVDTVLRKAMAKLPSDRHRDMNEFRKDLARLIDLASANTIDSLPEPERV